MNTPSHGAEGCYVVLHIGSGPSANQDALFPMVVRDGNPRFQLSNDIWIERLNQQLANNVQEACEPPHHNANRIPNDNHLYAFVRRVPTFEETRYEGMTELHAVISLSRLINPTTTGDRYSAKVFDATARDSVVQAIQYRGSPDVFLAPNSRDWLSIQDGTTLRKLMPWASKDKVMHKRIHRAYWNHESAMRSYYLDIRWTLIVSGFEALMNTRDSGVAWQFRNRVRQLATEFNINLNDEDLRLAYKLRSELVHAQSFLSGMTKTLPQSQYIVLYQRLEELLRQTVRRCLLDTAFGNFFRDSAAVNKRWRLGPNPNRAKQDSWICRKLK